MGPGRTLIQVIPVPQRCAHASRGSSVHAVATQAQNEVTNRPTTRPGTASAQLLETVVSNTNLAPRPRPPRARYRARPLCSPGSSHLGASAAPSAVAVYAPQRAVSLDRPALFHGGPRPGTPGPGRNFAQRCPADNRAKCARVPRHPEGRPRAFNDSPPAPAKAARPRPRSVKS